MSKQKILRIGIASRDQMKARTLSVARCNHTPEPDEPKVWFTSMDSLAQTLSRNGALRLRIKRTATQNRRPR